MNAQAQALQAAVQGLKSMVDESHAASAGVPLSPAHAF
jgi:hypothetical protein